MMHWIFQLCFVPLLGLGLGLGVANDRVIMNASKVVTQFSVDDHSDSDTKVPWPLSLEC